MLTAPCSSLDLKVNNSNGEKRPPHFLQDLKFLDSGHSVIFFSQIANFERCDLLFKQITEWICTIYFSTLRHSSV